MFTSFKWLFDTHMSSIISILINEISFEDNQRETTFSYWIKEEDNEQTVFFIMEMIRKNNYIFVC